MNIRRIMLPLVAACALNVATYAQTARQVLDRTASTIKGSGGIEAAFEATQFRGTQEAGTTQGHLYLQGNKFKITSPSLTTWFDGKTQWSLLRGSDEVNVSTPTRAELQQINPYSFIDIYKKGYNLKLASTTYRGKAAHEVRVSAQNKGNAIRLLILVIDPQTHMPLSVRLRDNKGEWTRIRVNGIKTHRRHADSTFRFDASKHPGIEVIDLR